MAVQSANPNIIQPAIQFPATIRRIDILSASHVTQELPIAILSALRFVHPHPPQINCVGHFNPDDETTLYIIICPAGYGSERHVVGPKYYITYQLDPVPIFQQETYRNLLAGAICNWDYSPKNVAHLAQYPEIKSLYVPLGYTPHIAAADVADGRYYYWEEGKDIDVLFLGWDIYEQRRLIKEGLTAAGLRVLFTVDLNLAGMQQAIRRAKLCLNLHGIAEILCLETVRLNILLSNQACVINEAMDDPEVAVYADHLITVPYDQIISTCLQLLSNPELRQRIALKAFQWYRREREWNRIVDFNSLVPSLEDGPL